MHSKGKNIWEIEQEDGRSIAAPDPHSLHISLGIKTQLYTGRRHVPSTDIPLIGF